MKKDLQAALDAVCMTYDNVVQIADDIVSSNTKAIDELIKDVQSNIENISNDCIRDYMLKLCLNSYIFSETKEKASFKAQCAEAIRKERYAIEFAEATGTVAQKDGTATVNISEEVVVESMYELVADLLKTKSDETHRVVDVLKTILMSRMTEAKLTPTIEIGEPGEKTYIRE